MWHVLQVYYYADEKEKLLIEGIYPILERLKQDYQLEKVYVRRHWKKGPHIDVFLYLDEQVFYQEALPLATELLNKWLAAHPSTQTIDQEAYQKLSERLGAWELEKGPYLPLEPDNSIQTTPYDSRAELLQGQAVVEAKEHFMVASFPLVMELLSSTHGEKEKRYERLMQMMACIAACYPTGITYGHLSFRSHVEAYLHEFDQNKAVINVFNHYDKQWSSEVDRLVQEVIDAFANQTYFKNQDDFLHSWICCLQQIWQEAYEKAKQKAFSANTAHYSELSQEIGEEARQRWTEDANTPVSDFHKNLYHHQEGLDTLNSPEFATYRLLVNNFYYLLPILGITPNEKHLLCYLVANAVERIKGVSWKKLMNYQEA